MKLSILGATGFVGRVLVRKALAAGHEVRVLARSPEKLGDLEDRVEVVRGDLLDPPSLAKLVAGADAVISVAGPPLKGHHDPERHASGTAALVRAMEAAGVDRLTTIAGAAARVPGLRLGPKQALLRVVLRAVMPDVIRTKDLEVKAVTSSRLTWTIVRPPRIGAGKPTRRVRALEAELAGARVDVEDVTDFILGLLATHEWDRKAPVVASW